MSILVLKRYRRSIFLFQSNDVGRLIFTLRNQIHLCLDFKRKSYTHDCQSWSKIWSDLWSRLLRLICKSSDQLISSLEFGRVNVKNSLKWNPLGVKFRVSGHQFDKFYHCLNRSSIILELFIAHDMLIGRSNQEQ